MDEFGFSKPPRASNFKGRNLAVSGKPVDRPFSNLEELSDFTDGQNLFGHSNTPVWFAGKIFNYFQTRQWQVAVSQLCARKARY
jgi:hypothetical protein